MNTIINGIKGLSGVVAGFFVGMLLAILVSPAAANIPAVYTNDNIWTSTHDTPVTINLDAEGNFYGETETGKVYRQTNIENSLGIRLHKFSIDEAFWYVSDRGIIEAPSNVVALSIYLTLG